MAPVSDDTAESSLALPRRVMALFGRKPRRLLPEDAPELLAEYGRFEFDPSYPAPSDGRMATFLSVLNFGDPQQHPEAAVEELVDLGLARGGWTAYGAYTALLAFFRTVENPRASALLDARLAHLHALGRADIRNYLKPFEVQRYNELYTS